MATTSTKLTDLYTFNRTSGTIDVADTEDIEEIIKNDIESAMNGPVSTDSSTPMGRIIEWMTLFASNVLNVNVQNAVQLFMASAAGQQLDAMANWFRMSRKAATKSVVTATVGGTAGSVIPSGSRASTTNGDVFQSISAVTIGDDGTATVDFESVEYGAIVCDAKSLVNIETPVVGWDYVSNAEECTLGSSLETDDELRERLEDGRATAPGFLDAIKNAVEEIETVKSSMVIENFSGTDLEVRGVPMKAHSIFVCAEPITTGDSGNSGEIAKAVFNNKPCGTGYTRFDIREGIEVAETVTDSYGNSYPVYLYKPESDAIYANLIVKKRSYAGSDIITDVKDAVLSWSTSHSFRIGETVYASDMIQAVEQIVPGIIVVSAMVSDGGIEDLSSFVEVPANKKAAFVKANITVSEYTR